ncbi:MAG: hypothetical protein LBH20_03160 [Treponema sp.]|jgi:hypothetical protein|nr:hypothetical protein [Treponema sp.]
MRYSIKKIVFLYFLLNVLPIFSQVNSNYVKASMDEIIQYAIRVSTEHITEEELHTLVSYIQTVTAHRPVFAVRVS